jgi:hypothetical protein
MVYHDAYEIYEQLGSSSRYSHVVVDVGSMRRLLVEKPAEARRKFLYGYTLLHRFMESYHYHNNSIDIMNVFLDTYPTAVTTEDDYGYLPLHRLFMPSIVRSTNSTTKHILQKLVSLCPETVMTPTITDGSFPLHRACECQRDRQQYTNDGSGGDNDCVTDVIQLLVGYFPEACRYRNKEGKFPLDYALVQFPNPTIVQILVTEFPVLLSFPEKGTGQLPIHRFLKLSRGVNRLPRWGVRQELENDDFDKTVEVIVDAYEGCLRRQDGQFLSTPLLQACVDDNPLTQIYYLVRKWPEQIIAYGGAAHLIFDSTAFNGEILYSSLAMMSSSTSSLGSSPYLQVGHVQRWLEQNPDLVSVPDLNGRVPLHYAVLSESAHAYEIVRLCSASSTCVDAANKEQHQQLLQEQQDPLAPVSSSTSSLRRGLVSGRTNTRQPMETMDNDGRLPIHYAAASPNCDRQLLDYVIRSYPRGLLVADKDGRLPWHYADCSRQDMVYEKTCEYFPDLDFDLTLVPEEIRWDILQVCPE